MQEPRGSLSKVNSVLQLELSRQDVCDFVSEMRDFLYCIYDTEYFQKCGGPGDETLTQSMFFDHLAMSPSRLPPYFPVCKRQQKERKSRRRRRNSSPSCDRSPSLASQCLPEQVVNRSTTPELQSGIKRKPDAWIEEQEEFPEVLGAQPYQRMSPTQQIMDRHHDVDDLTAHSH